MRKSILNSLSVVCVLSIGASASAGTFYVNAASRCTTECGGSWEAPFPQLQQAIDAAFSAGGGEVWVAQGDYQGTISLRNGVKVYGGFTGTEAQAWESKPGVHVTGIRGSAATRAVESLGNDRSAVLRGFHIVGGGTPELEPGAGMYLKQSSPMIVGCVFTNNVTTYMGGGVAVVDGGSPLFVNCKFQQNEARFAGGAVWNWEGSPTFENCLFFNNVAGDGGAVASKDGNPTFINCTLADNTAKLGNGGALYDYRGTAVVRNSILWDNACERYASHEIFNRYKSTVVTHSDIEGGWAGVGNISIAPSFVSQSTGDYRIQSASRCRDAARDADVPTNEVDLIWDGSVTGALPRDLDLQVRITGNGVDMGAYEWAPSQE